MKNLILAILLFISLLSFSQEKRYEFEIINNRTELGWEILSIPGEVVFYEDDKTHTISIITPGRNYKMYVKSKQQFIRFDSYLYTLVDDSYNESSIRIVLEYQSWDYITLYFYSNREGEKYFRLFLANCK